MKIITSIKIVTISALMLCVATPALATKDSSRPNILRPVDLCCTHFAQQYIGSHIIENASDTILA